jgi:hypothetical protein
MWVLPSIDQEFVDRMEDVLRLYAKEHDPAEPVVCIDERPVQLHAAARPAIPMRPGKAARIDYEYVRKGTANIFCIIEPKVGRRQTHATKNRKARAFAQALRRIARRHPRAKAIHIVMDNLNTHCEKSLVTRYGQTKGAALWKRFTVHYTPKHASWLDAAEMEASLVSRQCLGHRRISDLATLQRQVSAWNAKADRDRIKIDWTFRVDDARRVFRYDGITNQRSDH